MERCERVTIVGAGAMGAIYARRFYEMDPNCLCLLAGGDRGRRLTDEGLVVNGVPFFPRILSPGEGSPPCSLILVAVKHHHLERAVAEMKGLVGENTVILSVMNGIDSESLIGSVHGADKVLYAIAVGIDAVREENRITYTNPGRILFGEAENRALTERVKRIQSVFTRAGIAFETPEDMIRTLWWKFMINVGMNQVSAVLRAPYRAFQSVSEVRALMESAMRETMAVAGAEGIRLTETDIQDWYRVLSRMGPEGKTSMLQDVEAGRKTEVEMFGGRMVELGKAHGVPTPVNQTLYRLIRAWERMQGIGA